MGTIFALIVKIANSALRCANSQRQIQILQAQDGSSTWNKVTKVKGGGGGGWTPPPVNSMKNALIIVNIRSYRGKVREVLYFEAYVFFHRFVNCVTTFTSTAFQSEDPDDNRI